MSNTIIVGLQWGDEGKGKIVDYLTERSDVVARAQGGSNAGHTVISDGQKYILHLIPSGILWPGKLCVIANSRRSGFGYDQRIEAYASRGMVRADNVLESTVQVWNESGASADHFQNFFLDRYAEAYRLEMEHFADMLDGAPAAVGYADGVAALALAEAAAASMATGRPVRL